MIDFIKGNHNEIDVALGLEGLRSVTLEEACFSTKQYPLYYNDGHGLQCVIPHRALIHEERSTVLYVGPEYSPIHNSDIAKSIHRFCEDDDWKLSSCQTLDDKIFKFRLVNKNLRFNIAGEDSYAQIIIVNSYDGSRAFKVFVGGVVQVCSNGATIGKGLAVSRKHTGNVSTFEHELEKAHKEMLPKAIEMVENKEWNTDNLEALEKTWKRLIKPYPKTSTGAPNKFVSALNAQWQVEQARGYKGEFGLFMAATDIVTHQFKSQSPSYVMQLEEDIPSIFFNPN